MADVITLSSDESDTEIEPPKKRANDENTVSNGSFSGATVQISEGAQIDLSALGISMPTPVPQRPSHYGRVMTPNYNNRVAFEPRQSFLSKNIKSNLNNVSFNTISNIRTPIHQNSIRNRLVRQLTAEESKTTRDVIDHCKKGDYIFEAYEGSIPSRRCSRFAEKKRLNGKFVCSYDSGKCLKLIDGTVEFINHLWAHMITDRTRIKRQRLPINRQQPDKRRSLKRSKSEEDDIDEEEIEYEVEEGEAFLEQLKTCEQCLIPFQTIYQKQQHLRIHLHRNEGSTICHICEIDLQHDHLWRSHMVSHMYNEAPYFCKQCRFRTSVRDFLMEHYATKHNSECLICPVCMFQIEIPQKIRTKKMIFMHGFVHHMRKHARLPRNRCGKCALSFSDSQDLKNHITKEHMLSTHGWNVKVRTLKNGKVPTKIAKSDKISQLQAKFLKTQEGERINKEVSTKVERMGYDTTAGGNVLYECVCGEMKSFNGNRAASHYHKCNSQITETTRDEVSKNDFKDDEYEVKLFSVYPPFSNCENERIEKQEALERKKAELPTVKTEEFTNTDIVSDGSILKMMSTKQELDDMVAKILENYQGDK